MITIPEYTNNLFLKDKNKKILNKNYSLIKGNFVHNRAFVDWDNLIIGTDNIIGPMAVIGGLAQHKYYLSEGKIKIGNKNFFSEFCVISRPTSMTKMTSISDQNYFMSNSTIHHDCIIENNTVICSNVSVAGNVTLMDGAYLGQNSSVHQFQIVGSYSILGMNSCVTKKSYIYPGKKYAGVPCRNIGENIIGLQRGNITDDNLKIETERFQKLKKQLEKRLKIVNR